MISDFILSLQTTSTLRIPQCFSMFGDRFPCFSWRGEVYATHYVPFWHVDYASRQSRQSMTQEKAFSLSYCLKWFRQGAWPRKRAISRDNVSSEKGFIWMGGQRADYQISAFLILLWIALPFEAPGPILFLSSGWHTSRHCSTAFASPIFMGHLYIQNSMYFSPVNRSYVNWIIKPAKEPRKEGGKMFLFAPPAPRAQHVTAPAISCSSEHSFLLLAAAVTPSCQASSFISHSTNQTASWSKILLSLMENYTGSPPQGLI